MLLRNVIISFILASVLYGVTFEHYKNYSKNNTKLIGGDRGIYYNLSKEFYSDDYKIAVGDSNHRQYRLVIPIIVKYTTKFSLYLNEKAFIIFKFKLFDNSFDIRLFIFYLINFIFSFLTLLLIYNFLYRLNFNEAYCLIGSLLFVSSRVITYTVGSPLIDSAFYLGMSLVFILIISKTSLKFFIFSITFALFSKEVILPFLILIFFNKYNYDKNKIIYSLILIFSYIGYRNYIDYIHYDMLKDLNLKKSYFLLSQTINDQVPYILKHIKELLNPIFYYKFFHGFGLIYLVSFVAFIKYFKKLDNNLNYIYLYTLIISTLLASLSFSEAGRIFLEGVVIMVIHLCVKVLHENFKKS